VRRLARSCKNRGGGDLGILCLSANGQANQERRRREMSRDLAHAHDPSQVFLIGKVGGIVVDLHAVNSTSPKSSAVTEIAHTLLIDVANDGLGR